MRTLRQLLIIALCLLLANCAGRSLIGPRNPLTQTHSSAIGANVLDTEQLNSWRWAYEYHEGASYMARKNAQGQVIEVTFIGKQNPESARLYRNKILKHLLVIDDEFFTLWSQKMYGTRVISSGLADLAEGVMAAFVTASGAASAKSLGLAITGISTARLSAQKNIFVEQSIGALISTMEEDRNKVRAQMLQYMRDKSVYDYSLEEGLSDVLRYYKAGTLASAASSLQMTAALRERQSSAVAEDIKGDKKIAPQELERAAVLEFALPAKSPRRKTPADAEFDLGPPKKTAPVPAPAASNAKSNAATKPPAVPVPTEPNLPAKAERPESNAVMDTPPLIAPIPPGEEAKAR